MLTFTARSFHTYCKERADPTAPAGFCPSDGLGIGGKCGEEAEYLEMECGDLVGFI